MQQPHGSRGLLPPFTLPRIRRSFCRTQVRRRRTDDATISTPASVSRIFLPNCSSSGSPPPTS
jgi:hypothetical protein